MYLYNAGNEYTYITGGWEGGVIRSGVVQKSPGSINLKMTDGYSGAYITTDKKINLKLYNKLVLVHSDIITNASTNVLDIKLDDTIIHRSTLTSGFSKKADEIDISDYNGEYKITVKMITGGVTGDRSTGDYNVYEVYLFQ